MPGTIRDRLSRNAQAQLIGRDAELGELKEALAVGTPVVFHVHGLPGIGKSALLTAFAEWSRSRGASVLEIECGAIEPTERGVLKEFGRLLGCQPSLGDVVAAVAASSCPAVLLCDRYEQFGLLDTWIRQQLVPSLPDRVLVVLASRLPPSKAWTEAPEWQGLFRAMPLGTLADSAAAELLTRSGVTENDKTRIVRAAAGHPLILALAARATKATTAEPLDTAIAHLAWLTLGEITDANVREALRVTAVARRISRDLLRAVLPESDADELYRHLASLPFITAERDGLAVHDAVREALAAELEAADPKRHRSARQEAWRHLREHARTAVAGELWRSTADLIHLIRNPVIREAFFPRHATRFAIEPARPDDHPAILNIVAAHDGEATATSMAAWLRASPDAFFVVRAPEQPVQGFYCLLDAGTAAIDGAPLRDDPVAARFVRDVHERPLPPGTTALFLRRWLARDEGERPSPVQAACWLDVKRHYLERRPLLRRVYLAVADLAPYAAAAATLGFEPLADPVVMGNRAMQAAVLDMGAGSVDGWLLRLAAAEIGIPARASLLDQSKRALNTDGALVPLTRREFAVMHYLIAREGAVVTRDDLIQDVWRLRIDPGSNVVDAVVASLRRKLGSQAEAIETARGFGYVYRA
jgi:Transcriptional regulatory protein, C terminal